MKVIIIGNVRHDNVNLKKYHAYDLPEKAARALLDSKDATVEGVDNDTPLNTYIPMKNKVDPATGMRVPGEFVPDVKAQEPKENKTEVKGVESKEQTNEVKGGEQTQEQSATPPQNEQTQPQQPQTDTEKKGM